MEIWCYSTSKDLAAQQLLPPQLLNLGNLEWKHFLSLRKCSVLWNQFLDKTVITGAILVGTKAFLTVLIIQKPD